MSGLGSLILFILPVSFWNCYWKSFHLDHGYRWLFQLIYDCFPFLAFLSKYSVALVRCVFWQTLSEVALLSVTAFWEWFPIWWSQLGRLSPQQCIQRANDTPEAGRAPKARLSWLDSLPPGLSPLNGSSILFSGCHCPQDVVQTPWQGLTPMIWPLRLFGRFCSLPPAICLGHLSCPHQRSIGGQAPNDLSFNEGGAQWGLVDTVFYLLSLSRVSRNSSLMTV